MRERKPFVSILTCQQRKSSKRGVMDLLGASVVIYSCVRAAAIAAQTHLSCSNKLLIFMSKGEETRGATEEKYCMVASKCWAVVAPVQKAASCPIVAKGKADRQEPLSAPDSLLCNKQPAQTSSGLQRYTELLHEAEKIRSHFTSIVTKKCSIFNSMYKV